jgi:hypothetical protein
VTLPYDDYAPAVLAPARPVVATERLLEGLNPQQRTAVVHEGSPLLVVAGAGSGKTKVLTTRIAYLLAARGVHPGEVLAITFTNKAAGEMKERVAALVGTRARAMWVSTFHSACVRILRAEAKKLGFTSTFSIYDQADAQRLMTLVCRDLDLDPKRFPARSMSNQISDLKNELVDWETARDKAENVLQKQVAEVYQAYQARLREANAMDFDDLIMTTVDLMQAFPDVAEHYRRRFRHVLVDEYQDTNHAQYTLVRELVGASAGRSTGPSTAVPTAELCVVGDADQSIYAFRGADIRNIMDFEVDFPNAEVVMLEQNYRSTQTILSAANAVISRNPDRKDKRLWSDAGDGEKIVGYVADNEHDEAAFGSACRTGWSAACASTSARRSATRWPTCGCWPTRRTRSRCAASSTPPAGASVTGPRPASRPSRPASGSASPPLCAAARRCRASRPEARRRSPSSATSWTSCGPWWTATCRRPRSSRPCSTAPATSRSWPPAPTRRTSRGWRTSPSSSVSPASSASGSRTAGCPSSWSRSPSWRTPTRSPTRTATAAAWSPS